MSDNRLYYLNAFRFLHQLYLKHNIITIVPVPRVDLTYLSITQIFKLVILLKLDHVKQYSWLQKPHSRTILLQYYISEMASLPEKQVLQEYFLSLKQKYPNAVLNETATFSDLRECSQTFQDLFMSAWKVRSIFHGSRNLIKVCLCYYRYKIFLPTCI